MTKVAELIPEEIEVDLARLVAKAGVQLAQEHQKQAAQQQAQEQAKDPMMQIKQQEVQIKQQDVERKTQKDKVDAMIDTRKLELEEQEMMMDAQKSGVKMAADRRTSNAKIDLETMKTMQNGKGKGQ